MGSLPQQQLSVVKRNGLAIVRHADVWGLAWAPPVATPPASCLETCVIASDTNVIFNGTHNRGQSGWDREKERGVGGGEKERERARERERGREREREIEGQPEVYSRHTAVKLFTFSEIPLSGAAN